MNNTDNYNFDTISPGKGLKDKIKLLELSNAVDEWEQNVLFSPGGYYSLKGKEPDEKYKEYVSELESFINSKISSTGISDFNIRELFLSLKNEKISQIKREMNKYRQEELDKIAEAVFSDSVSKTINRAVLHKENPEIVDAAFVSGVAIIQSTKQIANREIISLKTFKSDFFSAIIEAFLNEKDIRAYQYFEKHKNSLDDYLKEEYEKRTKNLKTGIIAYEYAKELDSYGYSYDKQEKEIEKIKDSEIEKEVKKYLNDFKNSKKLADEKSSNDKFFENSEEIKRLIREGNDDVYLSIDSSLKEKEVKILSEYITLINKNGYIKTDVKKFSELSEEFTLDFEKYKRINICEYFTLLSDKDFNFFKSLQGLKDSDYNVLKSDIVHIKNLINNEEDFETFHEILSLYVDLLCVYKTDNNKNADIEARNKIIRSIGERIIFKKGDNINDGIINQTGE